MPIWAGRLHRSCKLMQRFTARSASTDMSVCTMPAHMHTASRDLPCLLNCDSACLHCLDAALRSMKAASCSLWHPVEGSRTAFRAITTPARCQVRLR